MQCTTNSTQGRAEHPRYEVLERCRGFTIQRAADGHHCVVQLVDGRRGTRLGVFSSVEAARAAPAAVQTKRAKQRARCRLAATATGAAFLAAKNILTRQQQQKQKKHQRQKQGQLKLRATPQTSQLTHPPPAPAPLCLQATALPAASAGAPGAGAEDCFAVQQQLLGQYQSQDRALLGGPQARAGAVLSDFDAQLQALLGQQSVQDLAMAPAWQDWELGLNGYQQQQQQQVPDMAQGIEQQRVLPRQQCLQLKQQVASIMQRHVPPPVLQLSTASFEQRQLPQACSWSEQLEQQTGIPQQLINQLQANLLSQAVSLPDNTFAEQPAQPPLAAAAAASAGLRPQFIIPGDSRSVVLLTGTYDSAIQLNMHVRLGEARASGVTAAVHEGDLAMSSIEGELVLARVAIKTFDAAAIDANPVNLLALADNELAALQLLHGQPNVVRLLAAGELQRPPHACPAGWEPAAQPTAAAAQPICCIVQELAECSVLDRLNQQGPMPEQQVQQHMRSLIELLQYMHCGSVVSNSGDGGQAMFARIEHRDIKQANLLLRSDGSIALADFGASCIQEWPDMQRAGQQLAIQWPAGAAAATGGPAAAAAAAQAQGLPGLVLRTLIGTPHYLAAEVAGQWLAEMARSGAAFDDEAGGTTACSCAAAFGYDASVDTYSAGVTTMEMLVGRFEHVKARLDVYVLHQQQERLEAFVDGKATALQLLLPQDAVLPALQASQAAREFVGCCCGVGAARAAAVAAGEPSRLSAAQLLQLPWMQQLCAGWPMGL